MLLPILNLNLPCEEIDRRPDRWHLFIRPQEYEWHGRYPDLFRSRTDLFPQYGPHREDL